MDLLNYEGLETPCIVVDHKKALENIRKMQQTADRLHVDLRPHIKTHKMPFYVSHVFREETGEALFEYITRLRMERAIQLLRESQMKIQDIAAEVGYEEQSYFSQVFKKYTGRTAGSYRKTKAGTVL